MQSENAQIQLDLSRQWKTISETAEVAYFLNVNDIGIKKVNLIYDHINL